MAIFDRQNMFSDAQSIIGTAATVSTDTIDLSPLYSGPGGSNVARDLGVGEDLYLQVNVTGVAGTTPTATIQIETADDSGFSSNLSTIATYGPVSLPAAGGQVLVAPVPFGDYRKFIRLKYTLGGTSPAGIFKAALVKGITAQKVYADAVVIG